MTLIATTGRVLMSTYQYNQTFSIVTNITTTSNSHEEAVHHLPLLPSTIQPKMSTFLTSDIAGLDVDDEVKARLEVMRGQLSLAVKHKFECFQGLRKTMGQTPRIQKDVDEAHEVYYQACRDMEEIEANMTRLRRGLPLEE